MSQFANKFELIDYVVSLFSQKGGEGYLYTNGKYHQKDSTEIFLLDDFQQFLQEKYPFLKNQDIQEILEQIKNERRHFHDFNKFFFHKLRTGHPYKKQGERNSNSIQLIDFEDFSSNIFRIVDQLTFTFSNQNFSSIEVELIVYINGIPLVVWAFKDPNEKLLGAETLINGNLSGRFPELLRYNAFCVICNGMNGIKYGISWGEYEDYKEWKRVSEEGKPSNTNILDLTVKGLFNKRRLLKVIECFICFHDSDPRKKIICRYPQFYGAIKLLKNIESHSKRNPEGDGKGGIYFGAAGCGKSYTMLFLSKLLQKSKFLNNPTILLITDRISLNKQLHDTFKQHGEYLSSGNISRIKSGSHLQDTLKYSIQGGIYSTTIQKFKNLEDTLLSDRWNIVCIADEAHRSNDLGEKYWDLKKPLSQVLRSCLPNATYVGFTATPRDSNLQAFGDVIDVYAMQQSIDDGFTVDIEILWSKREEFRFNPEQAELMDKEFQKMINRGVSIEQVQFESQKRSSIGKAYSFSERLKIIAEDIIQKYEKRINEKKTVEGKAMIVALNRSAACEYYRLLKDLKPEWFENDDLTMPENSMVNIIISPSDKDSPDIKKLIWDDRTQSRLLKAFQQSKSDFKIAIVCEMWLTGVDIPALDTMFLDNYITNHALLIQALSRVNRAYPKKTSGQVICYMSLQNHVERARKELEELGGRCEITNLNEIAKHIKKVADRLNSLFQEKYDGWDNEIQFLQSKAKPAEEEAQIETLKKIIHWIQQQDTLFTDIFKNLSKDMCQNYLKCRSCDLFENKERWHILLFCSLYKHLTRPEDIPQIFKENLDEMEQNLFIVLEKDHQEEYSEILDINLERPSGPLPPQEESNYSLTNIEELIAKIKAQNEENDGFEAGVNFIKRMETLMEHLNSTQDLTERDGIIKEIKKAKEEYDEEMRAREAEKTFLNSILQILRQIKENYKFYYSEEKLENLTGEFKAINDTFKELMGQDMKIETERKIQKEMKLLMRQQEWPPAPTENSRYKQKEVVDITATELFKFFKNLAIKNEKRD